MTDARCPAAIVCAASLAFAIHCDATPDIVGRLSSDDRPDAATRSPREPNPPGPSPRENEPIPEVNVASDCSKSAAFPYAITASGAVYRFDPLANQLTLLGTPPCTKDTELTALAVARDGTFFVTRADQEGFAFDESVGFCRLLKVPGPEGVRRIGFVRRGSFDVLQLVSDRSLYEIDLARGSASLVAVLDLNVISWFGTEDGRVYGGLNGGRNTIAVAAFDRDSYRVLARNVVNAPLRDEARSPPVAFWRNRFFAFADTVFLYDPATSELAPVAPAPRDDPFVVAASSTCVARD
jgi:hypothetical protein